MNQQQRKYAMARIEAIYLEKKRDIEGKYYIQGKEISAQQRFSLLKKGKVELKKSCSSIERYDKVINVFDFSEHEWVSGTDYKKAKPEIDKLRQAKDQVMDELMLGDAEKAIKLIADFEK